MVKKTLPESWQANAKAMRATQMAFDLDAKFQYGIRKAALDAGISPSIQIRSILGLPVSKRPSRPRLTVSLTEKDYQQLAEKYQLAVDDVLNIKQQMLAELIAYAEEIEQSQ